MDKIKVLLIVNPKAGKDKTRANTLDIVDKLSSADFIFTVKTTTCAGDATEIVKKYANDHDLVVCCGGDGTLNETINGIMALNKRIPIGYIPTGSTNDLACTIGIPTDVPKATDLILDGHRNGYDIGLFNNKFFSYVASFGPATNLSYETPQALKNLLGHSAYMINGLVLRLIPTLRDVKPMHIRFEYDGGVIDDTFFFGAVSNATSVGGIFKYDENDVKLDDGLFEVILVRKLRKSTDAFKMLNKIRKMDYDGDTLIYLKTSMAKFTFDKPVKWTLDGEFGGELSDVRIGVLPRAVEIISPENPMFLGDVAPLTYVREEPEQPEKEKKRKKKKEKEADEQVEAEAEVTTAESEPETADSNE